MLRLAFGLCFYFFALNLSAFQITLDTLRCINQQENGGDDEIYIEIYVDGQLQPGYGSNTIYNMSSIGEKSQHEFNATLTCNNSIQIKLFEKDVNDSDYLGDVIINNAGMDKKEFSGTINFVKFKYLLNWK